MPGFQPWVDSITADLAADAPDVTAVDVSAGLNLLAPRGDHDHGGDHDSEHSDDHDGEHNATEMDGHDGEHGDDHDGEHNATEMDGHDGEHSDDHDGEHSDDHDGDHDHGAGMDPHFWMDPLRVRAAADTVREGFASVDPANADAYADNTAAFQRELDALHGRLETLVTDAPRDVLLVAGHDSAQYLGARYGIEIEALTSVSPDDRPTPRDIERAQTVIDRHDLQYICADPLESQQAATQLVAATDAEAVLPLTAMPGLTETWAANDWGYLDVMANVNLPTLEQALGVA
jgi:zinc transport system substrate-binding protein